MNLEEEQKYESDKKRGLIDSVMLDHNPLMRIEIGTIKEVPQARKLAREIVSPIGFSPEVTEMTIEVLATVILHLSYAHYADHMHYPLQATLTTVANFFKVNILVEEWDYDENGIKLISTKKVVYPKSFKDTIKSICNFNHVPYEGLRLPDFYSGKLILGFRKEFTTEELHVLYSSDIDIYEINPFVDPWIYRNFLLFATSKSN